MLRLTKFNGRDKSKKARQREEEGVGNRGKGGVNCCERKYRPYPPAKNSSADKRGTRIHIHKQASIRQEQPEDEKEREKIKQMNKNKRRKELVKVWSRIKDSATQQLKDFNKSSRDWQKQRVRFPLKPPQASSGQREVQGRIENVEGWMLCL